MVCNVMWCMYGWLVGWVWHGMAWHGMAWHGCLSVCLYVCMYVWMCVYTCTHTYRHINSIRGPAFFRHRWTSGDDRRGTLLARWRWSLQRHGGQMPKKTQRGSRGAPQFHRPQLFRISGYFWSDLASCQKNMVWISNKDNWSHIT